MKKKLLFFLSIILVGTHYALYKMGVKTVKITPKNESNAIFVYDKKNYQTQDLSPDLASEYDYLHARLRKKFFQEIAHFLIKQSKKNEPEFILSSQQTEEGIRQLFKQKAEREKLMRGDVKKYVPSYYEQFAKKHRSKMIQLQYQSFFNQQLKKLYNDESLLFPLGDFFIKEKVEKNADFVFRQGDSKLKVKIVFLFNFLDPYGQKIKGQLDSLMKSLAGEVQFIYYPIMIDGGSAQEILWGQADYCVRKFFPQQYMQFFSWAFQHASSKDIVESITREFHFPRTFNICMKDSSLIHNIINKESIETYQLGVGYTSALYVNGIHIKNIQRDLISTVERIYQDGNSP